LGRLFDSYDEAWTYFLAREEPLESFFAALPEDESAELELWVVEPPAAVKAAVARVQDAFAHLEWIAPVPAHFLHIGLGVERPATGRPIEIDYRRVNCFHEAVVVEAHAPLPGLPHLSVGYVREPRDADELRRALVPLRDESFGRATATEALHVRVPAARATVTQSWTVLERFDLR